MTHKGVLAGVAVSALLLSPFAASADTLSDLQAKIAALLAQLSDLQSQVVQLRGSTASSTPAQPAVPTNSIAAIRCPVISRTVTLGSTGSDVVQLQDFLAQQGVYSDGSTGYFGPKTQAAVQTWQAQQGLVTSGTADSTGWGVFGPRSQSVMARFCSPIGTTPTPQSGSFSFTPSKGSAPLTVSFTIGVPSNKTNFTYTIYFGDGTSAVAYNTVACALGASFAAGNCPDIRGASHSYSSAGTYTASVYRDSYASGACIQSGPCGEFVTSGTVTVTAPNSCKIIDCAPGYHLEGAACSDQQQCVANPISSGGPVVTGVEGPASLQVGATGTWIVRASVASTADQNLKYSVVWGDESILDRLNYFAAGSAAATASSGIFTHAYSSAGTFTPLFTISNSAGSAQAGASVSVTNGTTPIICPVYAMQACPAGYTNGPSTTSSDGCYVPGPCVPATNNATLTASPASGSAPLTVHFTGKIPGSSYAIDYGDGSQPELSALIIDCAPTSPNCAQGQVSTIDRTHVYAQQGTYTAKLSGGSNSALATVTVSAGTSASGVTATAQGLKVTISVPKLAQKLDQCVYSVGFFGSSGNGLSIDWGDGTVSPTNSSGSQGASCTTDVTTHLYRAAGTYTIKVRSWHPGPTDAPITDWEGATSVTVSGSGLIACSAIGYLIPICAVGQHVEQPSYNGCPGAPVCVTDPGFTPITIYSTVSSSQSDVSNSLQTASALSALQAALEKLKAFLGQ